MPSVSSGTQVGALRGLVQRQNQIVLDAVVTATLADGTLAVEVAGQGVGLLVRALIDTEYHVGDEVMLARNQADEWFAVGLGSTGALPGPIGVTQTPPPRSSPTLHEAVLRLVNKHNQILRSSSVAGIFADGSLAIEVSTPPATTPQPRVPPAVIAGASTTQEFQPGGVVQAIRTDEGSTPMLVLGGA